MEPRIVFRHPHKQTFRDLSGCPLDDDENEKVLSEWHAEYERMKPVSLPYLNGLAQTCRLTFQESSHFLYQESHFSFENGTDLKIFIDHSLPVHMQAIKELTIKYISQSSPGRNLANWYQVQPRDLKLLKPFAGLKILHPEDYRNLKIGDHPESRLRKLMIGLAKAAHKLDSLQTITVSSTELRRNTPRYPQNWLDADDSPGWVYSSSFVDMPKHRATVEFIETLQRVHRPLWAERRGQAPLGKELASDIFEESLAVFDTED